MQSNTIAGIELLFFENLSSYGSLLQAVTTRTGGKSPQPFESLNLGLNTGDIPANIEANHTILSRALEFDLSQLVSSHQVHGNEIMFINDEIVESLPDSVAHRFTGFDALVTDRPGIFLMIRVADCVPLILFDPGKNIVAIVHAGWKGTLAKIAAKTVIEMAGRYGVSPRDIKAGIGPAIGPCCFAVGEDVAGLFYNKFSEAGAFITQKDNAFFISLREANRLQLLRAGCRAHNIEVSGMCTSCNSDLFFSHRREKGKTGRFGLLAGLRI
jgi:YfiH family protein